MTTVQPRVELPLSGDDDMQSCAQALVATLTTHRGVVSAELDARGGTLSLGYDPDRISLRHVSRLASDLGLQVSRQYDTCSLRVSRPSWCQECSSLIESHVRALPGVPTASVNTTAGVITVEYDRSAVTAEEIRQAVVKLGYTVHDDEEEDTRPLWLRPERLEPALVAITLITLVLGIVTRQMGGPGWLVTALAVTSYAAGGYFGLVEGLRTLRELQINVDLLMILAAVGAALIGSWAEGAMLLFLFSLSNVLQNYALDRSRHAIRKLLDLRPATALVRRDGAEYEVPVETLEPGEIVLIKPGDNIPVDGVIVGGESSVDQASITGESIPVEKRKGDTVFAGTVNQLGALEVRVEREANDTTLAKIIQMVEEAQAKRAPTQRFIDTFEQYYAIVVIVVVALMIAVPTLVFNRPFDRTFYQAMVLLVVASPCALVISTPASILSAIANGARKGILFKGGVYLEDAATIKAVAFDKTGTLTRGKPVVTDIVTCNGLSEDELLALTASAESSSEHPLALAVVNAASLRNLDYPQAGDFTAIPGLGLRAEIDGRDVLVGSHKLMAQEGHSLPEILEAEILRLESEGKTVLLVHDGDWNGAVAVADEVRPDARETIETLRRVGVEHVAMLTGDNERVASAIAETLGLDSYHAALMPDDKVRILNEIAEEHGSVMMIGDGVNDAPALATADIGVAMGAAGTDVALETADMVLMADDLGKLPYAIALSQRARRIVWQNIVFSLLVIATLIVSTFLIKLPLPLGVVGHEGSTVLVVFNGLRLLAFGAGRGFE